MRAARSFGDAGVNPFSFCRAQCVTGSQGPSADMGAEAMGVLLRRLILEYGSGRSVGSGWGTEIRPNPAAARDSGRWNGWSANARNSR
jgi:hypothetical protein